MGNGDHNYKHMVVMEAPLGETGKTAAVVCVTHGGQVAVYNDAGPAELRASQLRDENPAGAYRVISFQVL